MEQNRRQFPRARASRILVRISTAEKLRAHYLRDLSEGGIFIKAEKTLAVDTEVEIELYPPNWDQPLALHGRVVRVVNDETARKSNSVGMGVRFEGLSTEVTDQLVALVAEHSKPPSLSTADDGELERMKMQVQGLVLELGAARESGQVAERDLQTLRQKLQAVQSSLGEATRERDALSDQSSHLKAELERQRTSAVPMPSAAEDEKSASVRAELADVRTRLSEAEGKIEAYVSELRTLEEDDAATRSLAELLAKDKATLERARKQDQEKALNQLETVRRDAEQTRIKLTQDVESAKRRADEIERQLEQERTSRAEIENALGMERKARGSADGRADAAQRSADEANAALLALRAREQDFRRTRDELDSERARGNGLERQLTEAKSQLERVHAKERDLRRLLGVVSSKSGDEVVLVEEDVGDDAETSAPPDASPNGMPAPTFETSGEALRKTLWEDDPPIAMPEPQPLPLPLTSTVILFQPPRSAPSPALPETPQAAPPIEEIDEDLALDVDFTAELSSFENLPAPADELLPSPAIAAARIEDLSDFQKRVKGGAKLGRTERFFRHTPTDRTEVLVSSWLENVDSWQVLSTLAMGRMSEDHLSKTLFQFYKQGLVEVV